MKIADIEVTYLDHMASDLKVANAARVSFNKESEWLEGSCEEYGFQIKEKDIKLIGYLAKHKHFSPFNHCFLSFRVKAPVFVARQLVKHRFMPWNEVSRRYVDDEPEFYFPAVWRAKADNVKQGSSNDSVNPEWGFGGEVGMSPHTMTAKCLETYMELLGQGVCAEQARMVLPQNTMTEWFWSGSLGAFADMLRLRLDQHTQQETREVAQKIHNQVLPLFPISLTALLNN
jgi:thymidylate synthase (FAD)